MISHASSTVTGRAFDRLSLSSLPGVAGGHAAIFAVFALLNALTLPASFVVPVVGGNLFAAAVNGAIAWAARRGRVAARYAAPVTALVHLVSIGVVVNAHRLLADPMRAVFVSLGVVSAGWFVLSLPWLVTVVMAAVGGWAAVGAPVTGQGAGFGHTVFYLLASVMFAFVVQRVRRRNFRQLAENEEALRDLVDHGGMLVQSVGADGVVRFVNHAWTQTLGWTSAEAVGRPIFDFIHPSELEHCRRLFERVVAIGERHDVEIGLLTRDGEKRSLQGTVTVRRERGQPVYTRGIFQDVSEGRRLAGELMTRDALLRQVAEQGDRVFWAYDLDVRRFTYVSPGFSQLSGWAPEDLVDEPDLFFALFFAEDDELIRGLVRQAVEEGRVDADHRLRHRDGGERWVHLVATRVDDAATGGRRIVGISEDVTARKQQEQAYERLAKVDGLTGLANRRRFDETFLGEWRRHVRSARPLALLLVDVDHFKRLNDTHGHAAGDDCLKRIARALERSVRRHADLVARIGGEEFAFVLPDTALDGALEVAERVHAEVARVEPRERFAPPTVSVGVACRVPSLDEAADALVTDADVALYAAKRAGRDRTEVAAGGRPVADDAANREEAS